MKKAKKAAVKKAVKRTAKVSTVRSSLVLFREAHADRTITASKIYGLWIQVLGRPIKKLSDPPSNYNIEDILGYGDFLNGTPQFRPYGLDLEQKDLVNVSSMGDLGGAIVGNFQGNGWTVTPD